MQLCHPWTVAHQAPLSMGFFQARILEWVVISFSRRSSQPRDRTHVSCIGSGILYHWATWEAYKTIYSAIKNAFYVLDLSSNWTQFKDLGRMKRRISHIPGSCRSANILKYISKYSNFFHLFSKQCFKWRQCKFLWHCIYKSVDTSQPQTYQNSIK